MATQSVNYPDPPQILQRSCFGERLVPLVGLRTFNQPSPLQLPHTHDMLFSDQTLEPHWRVTPGVHTASSIAIPGFVRANSLPAA